MRASVGRGSGGGGLITKFALSPLRVSAEDRALSAGPVLYEFWFDGNGKITWDNGTFEQPAANAFSLVQVEDCPGATSVCIKDCYVHRLEEAEPEVHAKYRHNSGEIRRALVDPHQAAAVAVAFAGWIRKHAPQGFRWHVSGDIFSDQYAQFIAGVCLAAPGVPFWIYTRSFQYLQPILNIPNLVVNLSADADNYNAAKALHKAHGLRICYMTVDGALPDTDSLARDDLPAGSVIFPSHQLRGRDLPEPTDAPWWRGLSLEQRKMVCPPDFFGQSETMRCGPCKKCLVQPAFNARGEAA